MTQTSHCITSRPCHAHNNSSDLQHAQQRRRRQRQPSVQRWQLLYVLGLLLMLLHCSAADAQLPSRFFYAASSRASAAAQQPKLRSLRQTNADTEAAETASCCQGAAAIVSEPKTLDLLQELSNLTDYSESTKDSHKRNVRSTVPMAVSAICSPQPTIVELKHLSESDASGESKSTSPQVTYQPSCTRIQRCSGCCSSTLSCQPTRTEIVQLRVNKFEGSGGNAKKVPAIVNVEQHLACKCDCRIKESDCNAYQAYRRERCRCECQNTDASNKCLEQQDDKYWDDANCTCACRYYQSCTTGTIFDENECKCILPTPIEVVDRKRFIVQAVVVEPDNSTLYDV